MASDTDVSALSEKTSENAYWMDLYTLLEPLARAWAYGAGVAAWKGQEQDIAKDIVQATLLKFFLYLQKAQASDTIIHSRHHLCVVIAKHTFFDLVRHEGRLQHFAHDSSAPNEGITLDQLVDPSQEAEEKIYEEWALAAGAATIATFSRKLRLAILTDLANNSSFNEESSILQQALLASGIQLQDYQCAPSPDPAERRRQSTLRSLAYKRIAQAHLR